MKLVRTLAVIAVFLFSFCLSCVAFAEESGVSASLSGAQGEVEVKLSQESDWIQGKPGMNLAEGSVIYTMEGASALVEIKENGTVSSIEMSEGAQLLLLRLSGNKEKGTSNIILDIAKGKIDVTANKTPGKDSSFEIKTPTSMIDVKEGTLSVEVEGTDE